MKINELGFLRNQGDATGEGAGSGAGDGAGSGAGDGAGAGAGAGAGEGSAGVINLGCLTLSTPPSNLAVISLKSQPGGTRDSFMKRCHLLAPRRRSPLILRRRDGRNMKAYMERKEYQEDEQGASQRLPLTPSWFQDQTLRIDEWQLDAFLDPCS